MDAEIVLIRLLHIVPGVVWAGSAVLMALIIGPGLRRAGTQSSMAGVSDVAGGTAMVMNIAGFLTILFGLILTWRMDAFSLLSDGGWGTSITVGIVLSVLAMGASGALTSSLRRLIRATSGSGETAMMSDDNDSLVNRVGMIAYVNAVLVVVAVGAMAAARFV